MQPLVQDISPSARTPDLSHIARPATRQGRVSPSSRTAASRAIGALFLAAMVLYGVGSGLVTSVTAAPDFLSTISARQPTLALGVLLLLLNSVTVVGVAVLFFPILENRGKTTALAYLAARIVEAVVLAVGALCLLMLLPLSVEAGDASLDWARALASLAIHSNTMAFQIGMLSLGLGSVPLCALLFRVRLIPPFLSVWGLVGYAIFLAGAVAEIFGVHISLVLSIPGGLFELFFGFWLLIKGFHPEAYGQDS